MGVNREWLELVGLNSIEQVIGKKDEVFFGNAAESLRANDRWVMETHNTLVKEEAVQLKSGEKRYFIATKMPRYDVHGRIIGIIGNSIDITERKKMEEALKRAKKIEEFNELRSKFIQNMRNDIRTPVSGLEQTLSILLNKEEDPFKQEVLEFSVGAVEELKSLLNTFLNFDRERYHNPLRHEQFRLSTVFQSIYRLELPTANTKRLQFHYKIDKYIPAIILSDEFRIKHILLNLVGNALKFTHAGEVFFEAKLIKKEGRNLLIEFIVKDTGIGIPESKRKVVFEKFVRLEDSNHGIYKGAGLGLANVKEYVEQLGGEFKPIQSTEGKGTTFAILIPMKVSLDQRMKIPLLLTHKKNVL